MRRHKLTAAEIAKIIHGSVEGDEDLCATGFQNLETATASDVSFLSNTKYAPLIQKTQARLLIVPKSFNKPRPEQQTWIRCDDPGNQITAVYTQFAPPEEVCLPGIHPTAILAETANVAENVHIGPHVVVGENTSISENTIVRANTVIGSHCHIGADCHFAPNTSIMAHSQIGNRVIIHSGTVIGSDGFGYVPGKQGHTKIPQVGNVQINDDVEVGTLVAIDRARFGTTIIGRGTKIDNLVQVAHNVVVGENCFLVAQSGIAGSSKIGNRAILAGQAAVSGHIKVGEDAVVLGKSAATADISPGANVFGTPAIDRKEFSKRAMHVKSIPGLKNRIKELEANLKSLEEKLEQALNQ